MRVGNEVSRAHRVSKRAGEAVRGITVEVVFKLPADRIEVRLQLIGHLGHQPGRREIGHKDNAVFAKRFGLRCHGIGWGKGLNAHNSDRAAATDVIIKETVVP